MDIEDVLISFFVFSRISFISLGSNLGEYLDYHPGGSFEELVECFIFLSATHFRNSIGMPFQALHLHERKLLASIHGCWKRFLKELFDSCICYVFPTTRFYRPRNDIAKCLRGASDSKVLNAIPSLAVE